MAVAALINDPTGLAWFVVVSYFAGAAVAFVAGRSAAAGRDARFWYAAAILLVLLGLNKELDLQSLLTDSARSLTHATGWYEQRRLLQALFLVALGLAALGMVAMLARWLRRSPRPVKIAATGIVLLLAFILIRAASFHHLDQWVTVEIGVLRSGWWLELAGIAVIALSAVAFRRDRPRKSR